MISSIYILYSREQKHVSISDTPMLLIEINSISNMGRQKLKLSDWAEKKKFSANSDNFYFWHPMLLIELISISNMGVSLIETCFCSRLYGMQVP